jgi:hypothetical protein
MPDDHPARDPSDAIGELAEELLRLGAGLTVIVDHMSRTAFVTGAVGTEPVGEVLHRLLCDVLAPALSAHEPRTILAAVALLGEANDTIGRDLFLVDVRPRGRGGRDR